ncbi:tRNA1(Val) (adenine(37)-N6)-methyltransferase [Pseudopelagicola sp. nBUS_20]|uniref:tRNA1(Val) (adenine(37)-N6)-methyltransferase n=1 Tax=Pseudopelagicola sp. nBUS_20 TaxID=3395317 RepID=UPI003EBEDAE3
MTAATTMNGYLGGALKLRQPSKGYRAGVDPVLLAAFVPAKTDQSVLELGCGVGTAMLCLGRRVPGLQLTGLELQADYGALAVENAERNKILARVVIGDLAKLPDVLRQQTFTHVIANPPYFDRVSGTASQDVGREKSIGQRTPLSIWVDVAARRLAPKGFASFIHRAERLPDLLAALNNRLGSIEVLPLQPRTDRQSSLVLVRARKNGRAAFRLHAPVIMHDGVSHVADQESYTPRIRAILRDGASLNTLP